MYIEDRQKNLEKGVKTTDICSFPSYHKRMAEKVYSVISTKREKPTDYHIRNTFHFKKPLNESYDRKKPEIIDIADEVPALKFNDVGTSRAGGGSTNYYMRYSSSHS